MNDSYWLHFEEKEMNNFNLYDIVYLNQDCITEGIEIKKGTKGVIVHIYENGKVYLVEIHQSEMIVLTIEDNFLSKEVVLI